jgi:hypothetical protein
MKTRSSFFDEKCFFSNFAAAHPFLARAIIFGTSTIIFCGYFRQLVHEHEDRIFRATIFRFRAAQAKSMGRPLFTREEAKSDPMETSWVTGGILELCPPPKRVWFAAF